MLNPDALKRHLNAEYPSGVVYGYAMLLNFVEASYSVGIGDIGATTITIASNTFAIGTRLTVSGNPPDPLSAGDQVFVTSTGNSFGVSLTYPGSALTLSGGGDFTLSEVAPVVTDGVGNAAVSIADLLRWEIDYEGQANRPAFTPPDADYDSATREAVLPQSETYVEIENTTAGGGSAAMVFNYMALIQGGSATPGDGSGNLDIVSQFPNRLTIGLDSGVQRLFWDIRRNSSPIN
jgi:hypothetical protein